MTTSGNPLAPNPETDIDSAEIHDIPLKDLETGEEEVLDPEEEELDPPRPTGRLDLRGRQIELDRPQPMAPRAVPLHVEMLEALREQHERDRREPDRLARPGGDARDEEHCAHHR